MPTPPLFMLRYVRKSLAITRHLSLAVLIGLPAIPVQATTTSDEGPDRPVPPQFSHPAGFHPEPFALQLTHPDSSAVIYFSTDGSVPTTASTPYLGPIPLADRSHEPDSHARIPTNNITSGIRRWIESPGPLRKATVVRTIACLAEVCSPASTRTFFLDGVDPQEWSVPVVSIATDSVHLFSDETGLYVPGDAYVSNVDNSGNYYERGDDWERPASIELLGVDGSTELVQDIGIRIHGGFSRRFPQKSFRLYARSDYGESRFNQRIFPGMEDDVFNRLILRNSGNDFGNTMFMDAAAQELARHFNVDTQAYRPSILFLNGEFWGIHNFRERYDRHYLERVYGADPDNIDLLTMQNTVKEGTADHYNGLVYHLSHEDLSDEAHFRYAETLMDMDNFLDYYSAQVYYGNNDWPHNNIDFWRSRRPYTPYAPPGLDGRWRWLMYDVDRSLGYFTDAEFDMVAWVTADRNPRNQSTWPNLILNNLLDNDGFRRDFINRMADHLNTAFHPDRVTAVIDSLREPLLPVINEHIERWPNHGSRWQWNQQVGQMFTYAEDRPGFQRQHMMQHFDIGSLAEITVDVADSAAGYITVNTTDIRPETPGVAAGPGGGVYPWTGTYFTGNPVSLTATSRHGFAFSHWSGSALPDTVDRNSRELTIEPRDGAVYTAHFVPGPDPERETLTQFWLFTDDIPNNTPLTTLPPFTSETEGAFLEYRPAISPYPPAPEDGTAGIMDRVNDPTPVNLDASLGLGIPFLPDMMRGVRIRNPSLVDDRESHLILHLPTTGLGDPALRFGARRTANGQRKLDISWSVDEPQMDEGEAVWRTDGLALYQFELFEVWNLVHLSFHDIPEAADNPWFRVRIRFAGDEQIRRGDAGNVRLNNITLTGHPVEPTGEGSGDIGQPGSGEFAIDGNYPNPFNPDTRIIYTLPVASKVTLSVYNMLGQRVAVLVDGQALPSGTHSSVFHAKNLASGVYIARLRKDGRSAVTRTILLLK